MSEAERTKRLQECWLCDWIGSSPQGAAARIIDAGADSDALASLLKSGAIKLDDDGKRYRLTSLGLEFAQAHRRKLDEAHDRRRA